MSNEKYEENECTHENLKRVNNLVVGNHDYCPDCNSIIGMFEMPGGYDVDWAVPVGNHD